MVSTLLQWQPVSFICTVGCHIFISTYVIEAAPLATPEKGPKSSVDAPPCSCIGDELTMAGSARREPKRQPGRRRRQAHPTRRAVVLGPPPRARTAAEATAFVLEDVRAKPVPLALRGWKNEICKPSAFTARSRTSAWRTTTTPPGSADASAAARRWSPPAGKPASPRGSRTAVTTWSWSRRSWRPAWGSPPYPGSHSRHTACRGSTPPRSQAPTPPSPGLDLCLERDVTGEREPDHQDRSAPEARDALERGLKKPPNGR